MTPTLSYTSPVSIGTGVAMTPLSPTVTPAGVTSYSLGSGTLPAGVSFSPSTGVVSGTPTGVGITGLSQTYTFTIDATNGVAVGQSNTVSLTVDVTPTLSYTSPATIATGVAMTPLDPAVTPAGVSSWSLASGTLPAGVSVSPTTGVISGTPTGVGITGLSHTYTFTIDATNGVAVGASNTVSLTVDVTPTLSYTSPATVATGVAMTPLDPTVTPAGVSSYALGTGTLPAGVSFSPSTGVVSGTPTGVGITGSSQTYTFTIDATNGVAVGASNTVSLTVDEPPTLVYPGTETTNAGTTLSFGPSSVTPAAGVTSFALASGTLPTGVTVNSTTGFVSSSGPLGAGTVGTYTFTISALNGVAVGTSNTITLTVVSAGTLILTGTNPASPETVTEGQQGVSVSVNTNGVSVDANGWSFTGTLPPGLTFSNSTGAISGNVNALNAAGNYTTIVTAAHNGVASNGLTINWTVNRATLVLTPPSLQTPAEGQSVNLAILTNGVAVDTPNGWSESGTMPPGVTFNTSTGVFGGAVSAMGVGSYSTTVFATHDGVASNSVTVSWTVSAGVSTVVLGTDGSLLEFGPSGAGQVLSQAGSIKAISTVEGGNGVTAVYAIVTAFAGPQYNNTVWEFFPGEGWSERSSGQFQQIVSRDDQRHRLPRRSMA